MRNLKARTVEEYIAGFPEAVQVKLALLRETIRRIVPAATEKISYGMPTFSLRKNLVHFAAFKNHIGVYALPTANQKFQRELEPYITGKGSIQFPLNEELPIDLIEKIVQYRVNEVLNGTQ